MPLDAMVGLARVIEIHHAHLITSDVLRPHHIQSGERILFKTRNSVRCWKTHSFIKDFVHLSPDAAHLLAKQRVRLVGMDYLSVAGYRKGDSATIHRVLLKCGVWIIEGLNLSRIPPGDYELICLPLKIVSGDGAPARAIIRSVSVTTHP